MLKPSMIFKFMQLHEHEFYSRINKISQFIAVIVVTSILLKIYG